MLRIFKRSAKGREAPRRCLEQELNLLREVWVQLREYVRQRFDRLFSTFQDVRKLDEERAKVMSMQEDRLARIRDLE